MLIKKTRGPVKLLYRLIAIILAVMLLVGCGGKNVTSGDNKPDSEGKSEATEQPEEQKQTETEKPDNTGSDSPGSPATASESFTNYTNAKGEVITKISDALASNPDTAMDSLSFLGLFMIDLAMVPASSFGVGETAAASALGILGIKDIKYSEDGNQYSIKYKNEEGKELELQGIYDKTADSLKCTSFIDGKETFYSEYYKTSFGYVAQIYAVEDDGSSIAYKIAISGEDGAIGVEEGASKPSLLTGGESADFPKDCPKWYAIKGDQFTGVSSDGVEISFTYVPSEDD
ncbi:MAG: hypothetical protein ACOX22_08890 [Caldicoprobacterales bacterium]|jgi:hypothetical protein